MKKKKTRGLKVSVDGLEVRNDSWSIETIYINVCILRGKWYHEVTLYSSGNIRIGFAARKFNSQKVRVTTLGEDENSYAIDGFKCHKWHKKRHVAYGKKWVTEDTIGCYLDLDERTIRFTLNGKDLGVAFNLKNTTPQKSSSSTQGNEKIDEEDTQGVYPGVSLDRSQHVVFNFGHTPFKFEPPPNLGFKPLSSIRSKPPRKSS